MSGLLRTSEVGVESGSRLGLTESCCTDSLSLGLEDDHSPFLSLFANILPTNRNALYRENAPSTLQLFEQ